MCVTSFFICSLSLFSLLMCQKFPVIQAINGYYFETNTEIQRNRDYTIHISFFSNENVWFLYFLMLHKQTIDLKKNINVCAMHLFSFISHFSSWCQFKKRQLCLYKCHFDVDSCFFLRQQMTLSASYLLLHALHFLKTKKQTEECKIGSK